MLIITEINTKSIKSKISSLKQITDKQNSKNDKGKYKFNKKWVTNTSTKH